MAAASRSAMARAARAWEACVSPLPPVVAVGLVSRRDVDVGAALAAAGSSLVGTRRRTMRSFMCGTEFVPTAIKEGSVGQRARDEGVKATHALECGARFCLPSN